ncbi:MAG: DUF1732 domain-containing protein [Pseudomonadota bacterium]
MAQRLASMTGFGAAQGEAAWGSWSVTAKSVNGKGLDIRVNAPPGFDILEREAKAEAGKRFRRGNLQVSIRIERSADQSDVRVDTALLNQLIAHHKEARPGSALSAEAVATLMTVRGVVEPGAADLRALSGDSAVIEPLKAGLNSALDDVASTRAAEGKALAALLTSILGEFHTALTSANDAAGGQPALLKARLQGQLAEIGAENAVDADRLAAEVALSVAKSDVREELDRLAAHFARAETLIAGGSPVGRQLDFLCQEISREANTLCAKSASLELTNAGLALKALVDQFKEQAANVE